MANSGECGMAGYEEGFRHFVAHRTMLKGYVSAIVRDSHLAEDTLQDVAVQIAKSWAQFDATKDFGAWARGIARRVALGNIRKEKRAPALLGEGTLELIAAAMEEMGDESALDRRKEALRECMEQLPGASRRLIEMRYFEEKSYEEIGEALKRKTGALYTTFCRLHAKLGECVEKKVGKS